MDSYKLMIKLSIINNGDYIFNKPKTTKIIPFSYQSQKPLPNQQ